MHSKLNRRDFLKATGSAVLSMTAAGKALAARSKKRPNIVIILSDDQGFGDLSIHGNTNLSTPNIDSIVRDGAIFDRFYVCPVCAPTRAEFLTGRYHGRTGVHGVSTGAERMNVDEKTIADTFKAAGYATGAFGKWHNGTQYPYHPNARGFDEYYGFCSGHWGHYFDPILERNGKIVRGKGYITDDLTNKAMAFIEQNKDKPFFCYIPYNTPHSPFQVPDRFYEKFKDVEIKMRNRDQKLEEIDKTRCALAMCENIDWNVGRILKKLDDLNLAGDTIVIYFADNGPNSWRWNDGMKGKKGAIDEGGVRVPCMIRWPGRIKPGTKIPQISGAIDFLPTLADMAHIPVISTKKLDGKTLKPLLLGTAAGWPDRMIFSQRKSTSVSVRTQRYRLDDKGALFDMKNDPGQYKNIAKDKPEIAAKLSKAVEKFKQEVPRLATDDRPFTVGYPQFPSTILPARDGVASGNVKRSAKAPNCSFFTNWINTKDRITWDIEIATSGKYNAQIYYACPKKDVGSTFELSFNKNNIKCKVTDPHDPPLVGAEFDRVNRGGESYIKDFQPLDLGTVRLKKGRGLLTLKALDIPGNQVMEVHSIILTLL